MTDTLMSAEAQGMAQRMMTDNDAKEPKQTQIPESIQRLAGATDRMEAVLDKLQIALAPVLRSGSGDEPDDYPAANAEPDDICVTAHEINCQIHRLNFLSIGMSDLLEKVEA